MANEIRSLSRRARIIIAGAALWFIYVEIRTSGSYRLLGYELDDWQDKYFYINLFVPPAAIVGFYYLLRWINQGEKKS